MANWADFQTAIQFVAGLNLALYGLPELREPGIAEERKREEELITLANSNGQFAAAVAYRDRFAKQWQPLSELMRSAGNFCLLAATVETICLFLASGETANTSANPRLAWSLIVFGSLPAAFIVILNRRSRMHRVASLNLRDDLAHFLPRTLLEANAQRGIARTHAANPSED